MRLSARLHRLERATAMSAPAATCAECDNPLPISVRPAYERLVINPPKVIGVNDEDEDESKDCCGSCGRRLVLRIQPPRLIQPLGERP